MTIFAQDAIGWHYCKVFFFFTSVLRHLQNIFLSIVKKRMVAKQVETLYLKPCQRLVGVRKEWHTRKREGKEICYIVEDRCGKIALLTQKLPLVSAFINSNLVPPREPWTRVTTTGLWEILNQTGGRVGGWHKGRWRVVSVEIEKATTLPR